MASALAIYFLITEVWLASAVYNWATATRQFLGKLKKELWELLQAGFTAAAATATAAAAARLALRVHHEKLTKTTTLTRLYGPMKRLLSNLTHLGVQYLEEEQAWNLLLACRRFTQELSWAETRRSAAAATSLSLLCGTALIIMRIEHNI